MDVKHKFKRGDFVVIYDHQYVRGGGIGFISDRDVNDLSYLVQDLKRPESDFWIKEQHLAKISFTKPTFWDKIKELFRR